MKSLIQYICESKQITDIYGNSLTDFFTKKYGEKGAEVHKIAQLLSDYFYGNKKQYHRSDTSYLEVDKTWNSGRGRGLLFVVYPNKGEIWFNKSMGKTKDEELLNDMLKDNSIEYTIVKKSYDLWSKKWSN